MKQHGGGVWAVAAVAASLSWARGARADAGAASLAAAPIIGGQDAPGDSNVVQFTALDTSITCSGTLVAPNLLLTARHCLVITDISFDCDPIKPNGGDFTLGTAVPADQLRVFQSETFLTEPRGLSPDARGKQVFSDSLFTLCGHDVALVLLDRDLPGVRRLPLRVAESTEVNEPVHVVGWGVTNIAGDRPTVRQRRDLNILAFGPANYQMVPGLPLVTTVKRELVTGLASCTGDSGSPLFASATGAVVAVSSYSTNVYREKNAPKSASELYPWCSEGAASVFHTLDGRPFIEQAFAAAGHRVWVEGQPEPLVFGQTCTAAEQCDSGLCVGPEGSAVCSQICAAGAACPGGLVCAQLGAQSVCAPEGFGAGGTGGGVSGSGGGGEPSNPSSGGGGDGCQAGGVAPASAGGAGLALGLALVAKSRRRRRRR